MAKRPENTDSLSCEEQQSTDSITRFRLVVLGSNEVLINEACNTILRTTEGTTKLGTCVFREAHVNGRYVSLVKTPTDWLERLKTYGIFSRKVRSLKREMDFCYSLVFPGPHAFLLVLGDVRNTGKDHYLLRALSNMYGEEVLNYTWVLFMHDYRVSDIKRNHCVIRCHNKYNFLKNNEDYVLNLLKDVNGTKGNRNGSSFTKYPDFLGEAKTYFEQGFDARYKEVKATEESLRTKMTEIENQNSEYLKELQQVREELQASKCRENQLSENLDASVSRKNELNEKLVELNEKLVASISRENQLNEKLSFRNQLDQTMDALKKEKNELEEELFALRYLKRLTASNERECQQLNSDNEMPQSELEQCTANVRKLENNQSESKDNAAFLQTETQLAHHQEGKEEQALVKEQHNRQRALDGREIHLLHTATGSQHQTQTSTAATPSSVSEIKMERRRIRVKGGSIKEPINMSEIKMERRRIRVKGGSIKEPINMAEVMHQEDTGLVKKSDPLDGGNQASGHSHWEPYRT